MVFRPPHSRPPHLRRALPGIGRAPDRADGGGPARRRGCARAGVTAMDDYLVGVLSNIGVLAFLALSAYLLLLTGEISFGQQAFFAIGAYAAGIATAMWAWPLGAGLLFGALAGAAAALLVGIPTLRLHGLYFAIATLAFAEMVRLAFELFRYQVMVGGELVGSNGADGFRDIRYVFQNNVEAAQFLLLIYALLA